VSDDWDFHMLRVEGKRASMYVDLGLRRDVPDPALPVMAFVRVHMRAPRDDGLSSQDEFAPLIALEDELVRALASPETRYVGRCMTNGCRDLVFYVARADGWAERVAAAMRARPEYAFESGSREDAKWSVYLEYLYPSKEALQSIGNRRVCAALEKEGDALVASRPIDHWVFFEPGLDVGAFVVEARELGFALRDGVLPEAGEGSVRVQLRREDVPSLENIDEVVLPLYRLALRHGGSYDGWETSVER
jgi:hypothetical protein